MKTNTINLEVRTSGFEEATEKVEKLTDAFGAFPAQITIKSIRDCEINKHPSQTMIIERGEE